MTTPSPSSTFRDTPSEGVIHMPDTDVLPDWADAWINQKCPKCDHRMVLVNADDGVTWGTRCPVEHDESASETAAVLADSDAMEAIAELLREARQREHGGYTPGMVENWHDGFLKAALEVMQEQIDEAESRVEELRDSQRVILTEAARREVGDCRCVNVKGFMFTSACAEHGDGSGLDGEQRG